MKEPNHKKVFRVMGASNHTKTEREKDDFYATAPLAGKLLLKLEKLNPKIWECACGQGHLSKVFKKAGYQVKSTDLIDRGYGKSGIDFLKSQITWKGDIVTNPPYKLAEQFIEKALDVVPEGRKVIMFLKIQFLEGKGRYILFSKYPPKRVYISRSRIRCNIGGKVTAKGWKGGAICYAWFVWVKGYSGGTHLKWFN